MKFAEFCGLCEREWGEARGDVVGLRLTDESLTELIRDVLERPPGPPFGVLAGALPVREAVNPITRSAVKLTGGASEDSAEVRRYYAEPHPADV